MDLQERSVERNREGRGKGGVGERWEEDEGREGQRKGKGSGGMVKERGGRERRGGEKEERGNEEEGLSDGSYNIDRSHM